MRDRAWLCAAITMLAAAFGAPAASADPIPQLPVPKPVYADGTLQKDVHVKMSDGVELLADVARPVGADGKPVTSPLPVILTITPYNKTVFSPSAALVRRGYVVVVADARGTGGSGGSWDSFGPREQDDTLELLAWARRQPWSNGDLAMTGPSYMAINQLLAAERRPAGLKAIFPIVPAGDVYRDVVWHGGQIDAGFMPFWIGLVAVLGLVPPSDSLSNPSSLLAWVQARVNGGLDFPVNSISSAVTGGAVAFDGPFFKIRSPLEHIDQINVPTFIVGGWWDLFQRSEPTTYERLKLPPGQKQLLMGPWYHATPFLGGNVGLGVGPNSPQSLDDLQLLWFDRWLKGNHNGIDDPAKYGPVTLNQLGPGTWRREAKWPLPHSYKRLYMTPGGTLKETTPSTEAKVNVLPNPLSGLCARTSAQWTAGLVDLGGSCTRDNATAERGAATFTSAPYANTTQIAGPIAVHMKASTVTTDGFWVAEVTDVAPNGHSTQLTSGWLQMSRRKLDMARSLRGDGGDLSVPYHPFTKESLLPVTPGKPESLDIEIFNTNAVLPAGHRLRLVLRSSDIPHAVPGIPDLLPNLLASQTVHLTTGDPSYMTVPVVDRSLTDKRCVPRAAAVSGRGIGPVRIGGSLKSLEARYRVSKRSKGNVRFCVQGGGRFLVRGARGKVTFVASTAPRHKTKRVAPGKRVRGASKGFRKVRSGLYLTRRANPGRVVYRVSKGRASYLAVVRRTDAARARTLVRTLKRASLR